MSNVTAEALERLAQPFVEEGAERLYFTRYQNRVRVGKGPAKAIRGGTGVPNNIEVETAELDAGRYESLAGELNAV